MAMQAVTASEHRGSAITTLSSVKWGLFVEHSYQISLIFPFNLTFLFPFLLNLEPGLKNLMLQIFCGQHYPLRPWNLIQQQIP